MKNRLSSQIRFGLTIITLIFGLGFMTGCNRAPQQGLPGGSAPAVIEIWYTLQGAEADNLNKQLQLIMDQHPEVLLQAKAIPEEQLAGLTYQAQAGGEGPEIFIASQQTLTKLYAQGALAAVDAQGDAFTGLVSPYRYGDKVYAQPWLTDIPLLYYRTDGVQPPPNLTYWIETKGVMAIPSLNSNLLGLWWNGQGGKLVNGASLTLDDPANLLFLQQLQAWRDAKILRVDPNPQALFTNKEAVYMIAPASQAPALTQANIPWGSIPLSNLLGGQGQGLAGSTLGIANSSIKTTDALKPLIKSVEEALLKPEVEGVFAQAGSHFPASVAYYQTPEGQKGVAPQVAESLNKLWPLTGDALEWKLLPLQDTAWQKAWGGTAPQDALTQAQTEATKIAAAK
ncbi:extracellular solute-binding protein [Desulfitobacterium metallireducens]|uniref:ABC transporter substrate-binding protein n=1 Tax=Desulfitobacterium metallireducens DSM 15288 TaxID=871968 RepID=W0EBU7_9FIRM|nr:extracellular solute-binding protein [Desulfitobacterium metallireducens]AHF08222.1 ABC transporter substrate-binding protein [Desulfitobacterium metallireducens DSM 15288]